MMVFLISETNEHGAKTKALMSYAVTEQLICGFVFAYADCWFSDAAAHFRVFTCMSVSRMQFT